jgi:ribosomal protein L37E
MIRCPREHLLYRCHERGYTLDEVLPCVISQDGDEWTIDVDHPAYPRVSRLPGPPPAEQMPARSAPGFLEKVRNFATAAAGHVAAGMPMASDTEIIRRHDICLGCEHLQDNACTQCGCPVARVRGYVSKLSWADSECPVGKWGKAPSA